MSQPYGPYNTKILSVGFRETAHMPWMGDVHLHDVVEWDSWGARHYGASLAALRDMVAKHKREYWIPVVVMEYFLR